MLGVTEVKHMAMQAKRRPPRKEKGMRRNDDGRLRTPNRMSTGNIRVV